LISNPLSRSTQRWETRALENTADDVIYDTLSVPDHFSRSRALIVTREIENRFDSLESGRWRIVRDGGTIQRGIGCFSSKKLQIAWANSSTCVTGGSCAMRNAQVQQLDFSAGIIVLRNSATSKSSRASPCRCQSRGFASCLTPLRRVYARRRQRMVN